MGFIPTPSYRLFQTRIDIYKLIRSIKLRKFSGDSSSCPQGSLRPKSTFVTNINDANISTFENILLHDIKVLEDQVQKLFFNLNNSQRKLLNEISLDPSIVIKEAYKGGATVILNKEDYDFELN